jgi:Domain of unknown function (DUF4160)
MPVILRADSFTLMFYGNEGNPREPVHIQIRQGRDEAKFWLSPDVRLSYSRGLNARDLSKARRLTEDNRDLLESAWNDFFA